MKKILLVLMLAFGLVGADEFIDCIENNNLTQKCAKYCDKDKTGGACYLISNAYFKNNLYKEAEFYLNKACEKSKNYCDYAARIDFAKGDKYLYSKDYKQAEIYYKKACQKSKNYCYGEAQIANANSENYRDYFEKGNEAFFAKEYKQAEIHYKKACEKQAPNDDSAFKDFRQNCNAYTAMEYFGMVCIGGSEVDFYADDYGNGEIMQGFCMQLGDMYYEGNKEMEVEKNIPLAKKYWSGALISKGGYSIGYWSNTDEWDNGFYDTILSYLGEKTEEQKEIKPDYTKARLLAEVACNIGRERFLERGLGEDSKKLLEYIGQACEILGDIYAQGKGVKQNLNKAKSLYQKACENPHIYYSDYTAYHPCGGRLGISVFIDATHFGCEKLGGIYYLGKNFEEAKKWWAKAVSKFCREGEYVCEKENKWNVSSGYYQEADGYYNGYIIKKENEWDDKENKYIEKETYIKHEQDYTKAALLAHIGCIEFKDYESCSILANAYTQGKGVEQSLGVAQALLARANRYEAKVLYERAQELGYKICGYEDGNEWMLSYGNENQAQAVAKQRAQIKELLQRACDLDKSNQACTDLKNKSYEKWNSGNVY